MRPCVTIRESSKDADVAVLKIGMFRHGTLEFSNSRRISLVSKRFWGFEWELVDENGQSLCNLRMKMGTLKFGGDVKIHELVRRDRELMIMLLIGWYAMVLMSEEASAAAAGAAAAAPP